MADLKIKVSAETTAAEKQIKESFRSQTEASKRQLAIQTADYKAMLRAHESALKDNARFDINLQKQVDREKLQSHKEWLKQIKFNSAVVNKQIADEQKALMKSSKGKSMSGFQMLEFGENLTVVSAGIIAAGSALGHFAKDSIVAGANLTVLRANFKGTQADLELFGKATTGNLGEGALIKLSNRATDLGFVMKDQALLFDLAENAADAYGGSIEDNFDRVVNAISKGGKGLEQLGVSTKVFKEQAEILSQQLYGLAYKDLTAAEQRTIGFKTAIQLTGGSLQKLNEKLPDVGDNIANLSRAWDTFKEKLGEAIIANAKFGDAQTDFSKKAAEAGETLGKWIGMLSKLGGYIQTAELEILKLVVPFDKVSEAIQFAINKTKELFGIKKEQGESLKILTLDERVKAATDKIGGATIPTIDVIADKLKSSSRGGSNTSPETQKEIKFLSDKFAGLFLFDLAKNINALLPQSAYGVKGSAVSLPGLGNAPMFPGKIEPYDNTAEKVNQTLTDTQAIYGAVSSTMSVLGVSTDSFVGKLVGGFGTVLTIMESIKAVNSILSFIPGFASGGSFMGNSPMWVGEQGKELLFPNTSGYIMNHSDSMRFVNQNSSSNNVNVYLSGNIDVQAALRKDNKKYRYITIK